MIKINNLLGPTLLCIISVILIMVYGKFRCTYPQFKDPLEKNIILNLDGWSLTHVIFFIISGYLFPEYFYYFIFLGILWELFEHTYGIYRPGWLGGYGDCAYLATDKNNSNWWYGKWTDILANLIGFIIGVYIKTGKITNFL